MSHDEIINDLIETYPSGFVGGDFYAVVGRYGVTINWLEGFARYKEDDKIPIVEVNKNGVKFSICGRLTNTINLYQFKSVVRKK